MVLMSAQKTRLPDDKNNFSETVISRTSAEVCLAPSQDKMFVESDAKVPKSLATDMKARDHFCSGEQRKANSLVDPTEQLISSDVNVDPPVASVLSESRQHVKANQREGETCEHRIRKLGSQLSVSNSQS
jgi:hypothetical protein